MLDHKSRLQELYRKAEYIGRADPERLAYEKQKIADLERKTEANNKKLEQLYRLGDLVFGMFSVAGDTRRQFFYDDLRRIMQRSTYLGDRWSRTPSLLIRGFAARGREALTCFGAPSEDIEEFCKKALASDLLPEVTKDSDLRINECAAANLHMAARWAHRGLNEFQLSPDLAAGMVLTDMPETDEPPQMPFDALVISLPERVVPFFIQDASDGVTQRWADTMWVYAFEENGLRNLQITLVWRGMALIDRGPYELLALKKFEIDERQHIAPEDIISWEIAWRLLRNFLLWLEALGGIRKQRPEQTPRKLAEKRARGGEQWPTQWIMGREVKLGPELRRAAAEVALGQSKKHRVEGWSVRARFIVRGHWRNQACGAGRKDHKRKWIEPFWKGPAGEASWSHLYKG